MKITITIDTEDLPGEQPLVNGGNIVETTIDQTEPEFADAVE